ncbi:translation initiation factor IF-2 [Methylobacterium symbioticum]|uniref:DUF1127 domain-containing protein n=1 Tax=Methylobacterium symbioticum TaxID=2584084 RepID=A0A509E8J4_9HYPH|nr:translation initiation factor IF-2 [Methylobacterium symbioticum]VUD69925.1 hypothetical protein MET9862_00485 [Methylobacterium symbioticum]
MSAATLNACSTTRTNPLAPAPTLPWVWLRRLRARRALAALHPEQIREAGLDPLIVRAESLKPFWRA